MPFLEAIYREREQRGYDANLGDIWLRLGYAHRWLVGADRDVLRLGGELGASFPTGGSIAAELQPNAGFASQTVNPLLHCDLSYDFRSGLGFYATADVRWVPYGAEATMAHDGMPLTHEVRSGSAITYGGGARYRFLGHIVHSVGLLGLHRLPDEMAGQDLADSGADALYLALGSSYAVDWAPLRGFSLYGNALVPIYQHVEGTQLGETLNVTLGVRVSAQAWTEASRD